MSSKIDWKKAKSTEDLRKLIEQRGPHHIKPGGDVDLTEILAALPRLTSLE